MEVQAGNEKWSRVKVDNMSRGVAQVVKVRFDDCLIGIKKNIKNRMEYNQIENETDDERESFESETD